MAIFGILLVVFALSTGVTHGACPEPSCEAAPTPAPPREDYFYVSDPANCHKYYICIDNGTGIFPTEDSFWCSNPDLIFDEAQGTCVSGIDCIECGGGGGVSGTCTPYECSGSQTYHPDQYDCSQYYTCAGNTPMSCGDPSKPFFDGEQCQADESKCCHCKPYCSSDDLFKNVADPNDCKSYYFCLEADSFPADKASCAVGTFNPFTSKCEETFPCITMCQNTVGCDGCIDVFTCEKVGYFPKCPERCGPDYYHCSQTDVGNVVEALSCDGDKVYDPATGRCVAEADCDFDPPSGCREVFPSYDFY